VQGQHASHHRADVHREHHIVVFGGETFDELFAVEIGKQVYYLLQKEYYLVVCWKTALLNVAQIGHYL
jgi:hypothetical protein